VGTEEGSKGRGHQISLQRPEARRKRKISAHREKRQSPFEKEEVVGRGKLLSLGGGGNMGSPGGK